MTDTTLAARRVIIPLYQGDDLQRIGELRQAAQIAEARAQATLDEALDRAKLGARREGDDTEATARAAFDAAVKPSRDAYDAFVREAAERAVALELHHIGRKKFRALMREHEPRKVTDAEGNETTHEDDRPFGVNIETFGEALLSHPGTIAAPVFGSTEARDAWLDGLPDGDFEKAWTNAYWLNRGPGADPKAGLYSIEPQISTET